MLILSTKNGESEPKVTLCNQSGSLGVTRDFTVDDLLESIAPTSPISGMAPVRGVQSYGLDFPSLQVAVGFTNEEDLQRFMLIPQAYFRAVRRREPRKMNHATERLIFRGSVETVEQLQASSMVLANKKDRWSSCDLRVLETVGNVGWRTTRRLVLSSSAGEETPWCREFFLPLSWVQVNQEGLARQVIVQWSDCGWEKQRSDGNYHTRHDYIYDRQRPNLAFRLLFRNQEDAATFVETILNLTNTRLHDWASSVSSGAIYSISDGEPTPKQYRAVLVVHRNREWKYSEVFYIYGETDYAYDHSARQIRLPEAHQVDYISTHVDKLYKPTADAPPQFSHCEKKVQSTTIGFNDEASASSFMFALSSGYELLFSRRALYVTTKAPSRFKSMKSNKGAAEVQLWRQGNTTRLVSRWGDVVEDKWLTMTVPKEGVNSARDSNRASLPGVYYERGKLIAMVGLVARHPREEPGRRSGCVTVVFESSKDREEFVAAIERREPVKQTEELSDLIDMLR
ncbi:hypothetical protein MMC30_003298 [Trapelia coarctata]|nr:hypothetical protein [Trapelia coarctata]